MATIELERFPAAGGASTRQTITAWGVSAYTLTLANPGDDSLELVPIDAGAFFADCPFSARDKIVLWVDNVRRFHGWITAIGREATASDEAQRIRVSGPWWWLASTPIRAPQLIRDVTYGPTTVSTPDGDRTYTRATGCTWDTPLGALVWTSWEAQATYTAQGQINRALLSAIWAGAPIAIGTVGIDMPAPEQDATNATSASWILAAMRYSPMAAGWWDYSGATPTWHCCARAGVTTYAHALSSGEEAVTVSPLYDQQVQAVRIKYTYTTDDGTAADFIDRAGDDDWPDGPGALIIDADAGDADGAAHAWWVGVAARLYAALNPLAYAGQLSISEGSTALPWYRPGHALNLTGGRAEWESMAAVIQQYIRTGSAESDTCVVQFGAPDHLGVQDWLELGKIGGGSAGSTASTRSDPEPDRPGTYSDLGGWLRGDAPTGGLEFSALGGTPTLVGFAEYTDPSTPPKYYRLATGSGTKTGNLYSDGGCSTLVYTRTDTLSGACAVGSDGKATSRMLIHSTEPYSPDSYHGPGIGIAVDAAPACPMGYTPHPTDVYTATSHTTGGDNGVCHFNPSEGNSSSETGTASVTLTSEDTEDAAWDRLLETATWSEWSSSQSWASWQIRTTGRGFARQKFRFRGEWTGLTAGWWYRLRITLESRPLAGGEWTEDGTIEITLRAVPEQVIQNGEIVGYTGRATLTAQEVEAARGTERRVKSWVFLADA